MCVSLACVFLAMSWWAWMWQSETESGTLRVGDTTPIRPEVSSSKTPSFAADQSSKAPFHESPLWVKVDETTVASPPPFAVEWSTEGRLLVRISSFTQIARSLRVGDWLALPVPQLGVTYRSVIEEIDDGPGARAFLGRIDAPERPRRFVLTVGPNSVFAYIDTPHGPYELLADRFHGWLVPSSSLAGLHLGQSAGHDLRQAAPDPANTTQFIPVGTRD